MDASYSGLNMKKYKYLWRNEKRKTGGFLILFVTFTSTLVYSVIWNQSIAEGGERYQNTDNIII